MRLVEPFNHPVERLFCARCGTQCVEMGHLTSTFLLCPKHGEFTIAPVVMKNENGAWEIRHQDSQAEAMWNTCRYVDEKRG